MNALRFSDNSMKLVIISVKQLLSKLLESNGIMRKVSNSTKQHEKKSVDKPIL